MNSNLANYLEEISLRIKRDEGVKGEFSANAYKAASTKIRSYPKEILSSDDIKNVRGIGVKISVTIDQFLTSKGKSSDRMDLLLTANPAPLKETVDPQRQRFFRYLKNLYGFGDVKSNAFINQGFTNLKEIWDSNQLTEDMTKGVLWRNHIAQRVQRSEIDHIAVLINEKWKDFGIRWEICGSYKRGEANSGDIDIVALTSDRSTLNDLVLKLGKLIIDVFRLGVKLFNGMIRVDDFHWAHRIDIAISTKESWPFMILHATGSDQFNTMMSSRAKFLGYKLNKYSLTREADGEMLKAVDERDIFNALGIMYVQPSERKSTLTLPLVK